MDKKEFRVSMKFCFWMKKRCLLSGIWALRQQLAAKLPLVSGWLNSEHKHWKKGPHGRRKDSATDHKMKLIEITENIEGNKFPLTLRTFRY